jgi:alpha-1,6-mannosyltransferase
VIGPAGVAAHGDGPEYATGVRAILALPEAERRLAARVQAERFPWSASVAGFLEAHGAGREHEPLGRDAGGA